MNRSLWRSRKSVWWRARVRIAWCMVGTAVYQVACDESSQEKKLVALKPGATQTVPPAAREARSPATSPWTWNTGMIDRQVSVHESPRLSATPRAESARFRCVRGTSFGRAVVPEV